MDKSQPTLSPSTSPSLDASSSSTRTAQDQSNTSGSARRTETGLKAYKGSRRREQKKRAKEEKSEMECGTNAVQMEYIGYARE